MCSDHDDPKIPACHLGLTSHQCVSRSSAGSVEHRARCCICIADAVAQSGMTDVTNVPGTTYGLSGASAICDASTRQNPPNLPQVARISADAPLARFLRSGLASCVLGRMPLTIFYPCTQASRSWRASGTGPARSTWCRWRLRVPSMRGRSCTDEPAGSWLFLPWRLASCRWEWLSVDHTAGLQQTC
jgi:hypothetical protein